jgi:hypothetical protein
LHLQGYLEKAAQINPRQHEVLHMQGRLAYSVARLTPIERLAAGLVFPKMKKLIRKASFMYAIDKLKQVGSHLSHSLN